jgi:hypothetical protein
MVMEFEVTPGVLAACAVAGNSVTPSMQPMDPATSARAQRAQLVDLLARRRMNSPFLCLHIALVTC